MLRRLYEAIEPGGAVLVEKITGETDVSDGWLRDAHHSFKRSMGYSEAEIERKAKSIETMMPVERASTHEQRLLDAGFFYRDSMAAILQLLLVDCGQVMLLNFDALSARLDDSPLKRWSTTLIAQSRQRFCTTKDRRLAQWIQLIENLPQSENSTALIDSTVVRVGQDVQLSPVERASLDSSIRGLMPWRKGPFEVCGYDIDTEWRSDAKWERLHSHISDLRNRTVLDVGCGSGYHCWRMRGAGAALVMGLEPSLLFCCQFEMLSITSK